MIGFDICDWCGHDKSQHLRHMNWKCGEVWCDCPYFRFGNLRRVPLQQAGNTSNTPMIPVFKGTSADAVESAEIAF